MPATVVQVLQDLFYVLLHVFILRVIAPLATVGRIRSQCDHHAVEPFPSRIVSQ